jgi:hypothetical protein
VRVDEPLEQFALRPARLPGGPLGSSRGQMTGHRHPRPLKRAVGRRDAGLEQRRGLAGGPAEHVPADQRRPLPWRQHLQRRDERQLDGLPLDDDLVGPLGCRGNLVERPVRVRLQPRHLGEGAEGHGVPRPPPEQVEADVRRDPVEPGPEQRIALERVASTPGPQQRLLDGILGLVKRGEHPVAVQVQFAPVPLGQFGEPGLGARGHGPDWGRLTSWTSQPLPSGSLNDANEL